MKNILNEEITRIRTMMGLLEQTNPAFKTFSNLTFKLEELPSKLGNYNPSMGYIRIDGGNEWLASNRAISLKNYLLNQFKSNIKDSNIKINETKVLGPGDENQYVIGNFYGKMKKEPERQEKYPFNILYNFYDIDGVPHICVTESSKGAPEKLDATGTKNISWVNRFEKFLSKIPSEYQPKLISQTVGGGGTSGPDKTETKYGIMIPITQEKFGYVAKENGQLFFDAKGVNKFKETTNFIASYTADDFRTSESIKNPNSKQHDFTSSYGGAGDTFGDFGDGRSGKLLSSKNPNGSDIVIKANETSVEGKIPGSIKSGSEEEWFDLGTYKLDDNFFKDNMISIKSDTYKSLFDGIINLIKQKGINDFTLIELGANISAFSSSENATNRLPKETTEPDHTYGNRVPVDKWVQRD